MGEAQAHQLIGQVLHDTYRIERLIGEGGMGAVYEAAHLRLVRRFAIKVLFPAVAAHPEALTRFRREAEITSALGHPHIVDVTDFYNMPDGTPYLVMELLDGEDLAGRLQRGPRLELREVASMLRQAASGLQAAHQQGIVHRDLKPSNIFLCRRGERDNFVKIVDFGISKVLSSQSAMTKTHAMMGTPFYMAPEQAEQRAAEVDVRTDVYAMGTILYEMLAGRPPFLADSIPSLLYLIVHKDPPSIRSVRADVPEAVEHVIQKAMRKLPGERYGSIGEVWRDFASALDMRDFDEPTEDRQTRWTRPEVPVVGGAVGRAEASELAATAGAGLEAVPTEQWKLEEPEEPEEDLLTEEWTARERGEAVSGPSQAALPATDRPSDIPSTIGAPVPLVRRKARAARADPPDAPGAADPARVSPGPVAGMSTLSSSVGEVRQPPRPRLGARRVVVIAALPVAVVAGAVMLGLYYRGNQQESEQAGSAGTRLQAAASSAPDWQTVGKTARTSPMQKLPAPKVPSPSPSSSQHARLGTPSRHPVPDGGGARRASSVARPGVRKPKPPPKPPNTTPVAKRSSRKPGAGWKDPFSAAHVKEPRVTAGMIYVLTMSEGDQLWANVYLDGKSRGQTPFLVKEVKPGPHIVEVRREGYQTQSKTVNLKPGQKLDVLFVLQR